MFSCIIVGYLKIDIVPILGLIHSSRVYMITLGIKRWWENLEVKKNGQMNLLKMLVYFVSFLISHTFARTSVSSRNIIPALFSQNQNTEDMTQQ